MKEMSGKHTYKMFGIIYGLILYMSMGFNKVKMIFPPKEAISWYS